jgi:hypothetical protein
MSTDARNQVGLRRQLDQVVRRSIGKRSSPRGRIVIAGEDDDGRARRLGVRSKQADQCQPVDVRHDEILKHYRWDDLVGHRNGVYGLMAAMKLDVWLGREQLPDGCADEPLVVHQQNDDRPGLL